MKPMKIVSLARDVKRPTTKEWINAVFDDFIELHGDRYYADDRALVGGIATLNGKPVTVIGMEKGHTLQENLKTNFGQVHPEGYRKSARLMKQAEKFNRPVVTFINTAGAFCGATAEERGIGEAIARAYLEQGENVVLTGRRTDRLEALKSEFAVTYPNQTVWTFPLDVTDMAMVKTVCFDILETIRQIDILVNNAGLALGLAPYVGYQCQRFDGSHSLFLAFYGSSQSRSYYQHGINRRNLCLCRCSCLFSHQGSS